MTILIINYRTQYTETVKKISEKKLLCPAPKMYQNECLPFLLPSRLLIFSLLACFRPLHHQSLFDCCPFYEIRPILLPLSSYSHFCPYGSSFFCRHGQEAPPPWAHHIILRCAFFFTGGYLFQSSLLMRETGNLDWLNEYILQECLFCLPFFLAGTGF